MNNDIGYLSVLISLIIKNYNLQIETYLMPRKKRIIDNLILDSNTYLHILQTLIFKRA